MFDVTDTTIPCSGNVMSDTTMPPKAVPILNRVFGATGRVLTSHLDGYTL